MNHRQATLISRFIPGGCLLPLLLMAQQASADVRQLGSGVDLHYNALPSIDLPAPVMKSYGLKRSKNLGLLNISLVERAEDPMGGPPLRKGVEAASIQCTATNLNNQQRELEIKAVKAGEAVYHLALFPIESEDKVQFSCAIEVPESAGGGQLDEKERMVELDFKKSFQP